MGDVVSLVGCVEALWRYLQYLSDSYIQTINATSYRYQLTNTMGQYNSTIPGSYIRLHNT